VPSDGERKYKGWSDEGMEAFEEWVKDMQKDVAKDKQTVWEAAYCIIVEEKVGNGKKNDEKPVQQKKYEPSMGVVWEVFNVA
jgi:hypothetical protein